MDIVPGDGTYDKSTSIRRFGETLKDEMTGSRKLHL
jgi:hypothetical protein